MSANKKMRKESVGTCRNFPSDDTLGVVLSFLNTYTVIRSGLYLVSKEWNRILHQLPHSWCPVVDLFYWNVPADAFAWRGATVSGHVCLY